MARASGEMAKWHGVHGCGDGTWWTHWTYLFRLDHAAALADRCDELLLVHPQRVLVRRYRVGHAITAAGVGGYLELDTARYTDLLRVTLGNE